ncbi:MAG: glycosyltransferase family 2 protein [Planctomycetes bacterium]|nr:glycosyltransferase family 2 protein [Planctomycetota bacterium]
MSPVSLLPTAPSPPVSVGLLSEVRACALIPTYDNPATVADVVRRAQAHLPVIVVDDGSGPVAAEVLAGLSGVHLIRHARNRGKGAALRTGFDAARRLGFSHAISLDADGQHLPEDLPALLAAARAEPSALILGVRDLAGSGAGWGSRIGCWLSNAWLRLAGGPALADTQTGFRVYPLEAIGHLGLRGVRYDLEVEVLARASWEGLALRSRPIQVRYFPREERVSHMGVLAMARVALAWLALLGERILGRRRFSRLPASHHGDSGAGA